MKLPAVFGRRRKPRMAGVQKILSIHLPGLLDRWDGRGAVSNLDPGFSHVENTRGILRKPFPAIQASLDGTADELH